LIQVNENYAVEVIEDLSNYRIKNMHNSKVRFGATTQLRRKFYVFITSSLV
jgi:hypothetical protein